MLSADGRTLIWAVEQADPGQVGKHSTLIRIGDLPVRRVWATIKDPGSSGLIVTQGSGTIGKVDVDSPNYIRFGEMTEDEFFVTAAAAQEGVVIENLSTSDPLVMLKHFGPGNPDAQPLVRS